MTICTSPIGLLKPQTQEFVDASLLDAITQKQTSDWLQAWVPSLQSAMQQMAAFKHLQSDGPQFARWDWRRKAEAIQGLLGKNGFSVVCEEMTQGLMVVDLVTHRGRLDGQRGKDLVYVEFLEIAPWNRAELPPGNPRFSGVGSTLMLAAVQLSLSEGFQGRVGLHSLPKTEFFYAKACGMTDLGIDESVEGLRYFEMTAEQAAAFVRKGN